VSDQPAPDQPTLHLVRGDAAPEELAALLAVLSARSASAEAPAAPTTRAGRWGDPARSHRQPPIPGPGAWRASGLPR
jgi:hypothetical protein